MNEASHVLSLEGADVVSGTTWARHTIEVEAHLRERLPRVDRGTRGEQVEVERAGVHEPGIGVELVAR